MSKELFSYIFVVLLLLVGALYYNKTIQSPIIGALNSFKSSYHDSRQYISDKIEKYFFQAQTIEELKAELANYEKNHLVMQQLASEIQDLYQENNSTLKLTPDVALVKAIAYEKFGNFNRVWLDMSDFNASKVYGLVYKELVAGIVISSANRPLALLNKEAKSAYSVLIGAHLAPGIANGMDGEFIAVNFIPTWVEIKVGDEVVTSGLDNIFFKGLKVGRVISIDQSGGYQSARVEQYYKGDAINYFHVIRSVR